MRELRFLVHLWRTNLAAAMEYRAAFLTQAVGMMLNNAVYFLIWVIFFDRFEEVRGWSLDDMLVLFGVTATAFGLVSMLFGNAFGLSDVIARGRLDYYLSLPRPVLLHVLASRGNAAGFGDFTYGILSFAASGHVSADGLARFGLAVILAAAVFVAFLVIVNSLAFWMGSAGFLGTAAVNAMVTFALYPIALFDSGARLLLFTVVPAALMGAVPAGFAREFSWPALGQLLVGAVAFVALARFVFERGLRRYESGSAIQVEV